MANLLKPSVDQIVFSQSSIVQPVRRHPEQNYNVSYLAQNDDREPVAKRVAGVVRVVATAAVLIASFAITGLI
jgi:hypothetical protein